MANMHVTSVSAARNRKDPQDRYSAYQTGEPGLFASILHNLANNREHQQDAEAEAQNQNAPRRPAIGSILRLVKNPVNIQLDDNPFSFSVLA